MGQNRERRAFFFLPPCALFFFLIFLIFFLVFFSLGNSENLTLRLASQISQEEEDEARDIREEERGGGLWEDRCLKDEGIILTLIRCIHRRRRRR